MREEGIEGERGKKKAGEGRGGRGQMNRDELK